MARFASSKRQYRTTIQFLAFCLSSICGIYGHCSDSAPQQDSVLHFRREELAYAPKSPVLEVGDQFTLSAWVRPSASPPSTEGDVLARGDGVTGYLGIIVLTGSGPPVAVFNIADKSLSESVTFGEPLELNMWTNLLVRFDRGTIETYRNGLLIAEGKTTIPIVPFEDPWRVGRNFVGDIAQVKIWDMPHRPLELSVGSAPNPSVYWPLDDGAGRTARDVGDANLPLAFGEGARITDKDPRWRSSAVRNIYFRRQFQYLNSAVPFLSVPIDFDNDGDTDLLYLDWIGPDIVTNDPPYYNGKPPTPSAALRNDGKGNFSDATIDVFGPDPIQFIWPRNFAVADFDGNGLLDVFVNDHGPDPLPNPRPGQDPFPGGQSRILMQVAKGQLRDQTAQRLPEGLLFTHTSSAGDIDGDQDIDLFLGTIGGQHFEDCAKLDFSQTPGCPAIYVNDGSGQFTADYTRLPEEWVRDRFALGVASEMLDADLDGDLDLVLGGTEPHPRLLLNDGSGHFSNTPQSTIPPRKGGFEFVEFCSGDFDNNGYVDVLGSSYYEGIGFQLFMNNGDLTFREEPIELELSDGTPGFAAYVAWCRVADFNSDGAQDFLTFGIDQDSDLFYNLGSGAFEVAPVIADMGVADFHPVDVDGDGDIDLLGSQNLGVDVFENVLSFSGTIFADDFERIDPPN